MHKFPEQAEKTAGLIHKDLIPKQETAKENQFNYSAGMDTAKGVSEFLTNIHYFRSSALDQGDMDAVLMIADMNEAFSGVTMTARQSEALYLVFYKGLNQREASDEMQVSKQAIQQMIHSVTAKIAEKFVSKAKKSSVSAV